MHNLNRKIICIKAFTVIEIITVIMIIGIIAVIAIPRFTNAAERVRAGEAIHTLAALLAAQQRFFLENGAYQAGTGGSNDLADGDLDVDIPASGMFDVPKIFNNAAGVASITRQGSSPDYRLTISAAGDITCDQPDPAEICSKIGY